MPVQRKLPDGSDAPLVASGDPSWGRHVAEGARQAEAPAGVTAPLGYDEQGRPRAWHSGAADIGSHNDESVTQAEAERLADKLVREGRLPW